MTTFPTILWRSLGSSICAALALTSIVACSSSSNGLLGGGGGSSKKGRTNAAIRDFQSVISLVTPEMTQADAAQAGFLTEISPRQWDGSVGEVDVFVAFNEAGRLLVGRAGISGENLLAGLAPSLERQYGAVVRRVEDQWGDGEVSDFEAALQSPGTRSEVKLAYPGEVDLVYHSSYRWPLTSEAEREEGGDESPPPTRPQETTLRLGGS